MQRKPIVIYTLVDTLSALEANLEAVEKKLESKEKELQAVKHELLATKEEVKELQLKMQKQEYPTPSKQMKYLKKLKFIIFVFVRVIRCSLYDKFGLW